MSETTGDLIETEPAPSVFFTVEVDLLNTEDADHLIAALNTTTVETIDPDAKVAVPESGGIVGLMLGDGSIMLGVAHYGTIRVVETTIGTEPVEGVEVGA